jgi:hypothetical protein
MLTHTASNVAALDQESHAVVGYRLKTLADLQSLTQTNTASPLAPKLTHASILDLCRETSEPLPSQVTPAERDFYAKIGLHLETLANKL